MQNEKRNIAQHWKFLSPSGCFSEASKKKKNCDLHEHCILKICFMFDIGNIYKKATSCLVPQEGVGGKFNLTAFLIFKENTVTVTYLQYKTIACIVLKYE